MRKKRTELAARRRNRGHTQETLAQHLGVDVSSVARWERGLTAPSPALLTALARELAVSLEELASLLTSPDDDPPSDLIRDSWSGPDAEGLAASLATATPEPSGHTVQHVVHQWLVTASPDFVTREEKGTSVGMSTVQRIHDRIQYLRHADDLLAGGELTPVIQAEVAATSRLLRSGSYRSTVGQRLLSAVAELCQLAAWSTSDAGDDDAAEKYLIRGISAAHAADDHVLATHLVSSLAYHHAEFDDPSTAVLLAQSALARVPTGSLTPAVRALLRARLAWAHAKAGDVASATKTMNQAREDYASRHPDDPDPAWVYWLTEDEMAIIAGRCQTVTGKPEEAQRLLRQGMRACDPRRVRENALYTTWLAEAHLQTGDLAQATRLTSHAKRLNACISSSFSHRALHTLTRRLATP